MAGRIMSRAPRLHQLVARVPAESAEDLGAWLVGAGAGAVEEREGPRRSTLVVHSEDRGSLESLARGLRRALAGAGIRGGVGVRASPARLSGWSSAATRVLSAVRISPRLVVAPLGGEPEPGPGERVIVLEPALTFGFGDHPTTRMAARAVAERVTAGAASLLDVGTGSGILAIVAACHGCRRVVGVDVEASAVAAAGRNALRNGVAARCSFSSAPVAALRSRFHVVVANLDYRTHVDVARFLAARLAPGGDLLVTGFLDEHARDVEALYAGAGLLRRGKRRLEGGFTLLGLSRAGSSAPRRGAPRRKRRETTRMPRSR